MSSIRSILEHKKDKPIKIGSAPTYGESGMADIDQSEEMSDCYLVDYLNDKHKLDN